MRRKWFSPRSCWTWQLGWACSSVTQATPSWGRPAQSHRRSPNSPAKRATLRWFEPPAINRNEYHITCKGKETEWSWKKKNTSKDLPSSVWILCPCGMTAVSNSSFSRLNNNRCAMKIPYFYRKLNGSSWLLFSVDHSPLLLHKLFDGVAVEGLPGLEDIERRLGPRWRDVGDVLTVCLHDVQIAVQVDADERVGRLDEVVRFVGTPCVCV